MPQPSDLYLFEWLSQQEVVYFLMMSETRYVKSGEIIIKEGDEKDAHAYYIQSGSFDVIKGVSVIATAGAWELVGEIALVTNEPRTATVRAREASEVLVIARDEFLMLWKKSPFFADMQRTIFGRIRENFQRDQERS